MFRTWIMAAVASLAASGAALAEVTDVSQQGFETRQKVEIAAPAAKVWAALIRPGEWWDSQHTWSGDAHNLSLDPRPGGCWCERFPKGGGSVHMTVVNVAPGRQLTLDGGLGPFQSTGASGHMAWTLAEAGGKTTLTMTYDVGGYVKGGIDRLAQPVDGVLGGQVARLKRVAETGMAE
jgi:uncharacterized protein YndB with AHSA1/START domain